MILKLYLTYSHWVFSILGIQVTLMSNSNHLSYCKIGQNSLLKENPVCMWLLFLFEMQRRSINLHILGRITPWNSCSCSTLKILWSWCSLERGFTVSQNCWSWKGPLEVHLVQPPWTSSDSESWLPKTMSKDRDFTASLVDRFQRWTTFTLKKKSSTCVHIEFHMF